jgi:hypothetical protein
MRISCYHEYLSWPLAIDTLEALASTSPAQGPLEAGDIDDPGPWLEAYSAGTGSTFGTAVPQIVQTVWL